MGKAVNAKRELPVLSVSYKYFLSTCSFSRSKRDKSDNATRA